jgi:hypothetical protein
MGETAYMTECMGQNSGVKPDIDSKYLKKFSNLYTWQTFLLTVFTTAGRW